MDIISNPVQISCYHRFCSECINSFLNEKSTKLSCPVCRKSIKRQRQDPDNAFKQHVQFVMNVNKKLIDQFRCDSKLYRHFIVTLLILLYIFKSQH